MTVSSLDRVEIAKKCPADWDGMKGDDRVRFCGLCELNVYNLAGLSRGEAEALLQTSEGRTCVRLFRREDGTVITRDCPVGLAAIRRRMAGLFASIAGALALVFGAFGLQAWASGSAGTRGKLLPTVIPGAVEMGEPCISIPPPAPTPPAPPAPTTGS